MQQLDEPFRDKNILQQLDEPFRDKNMFQSLFLQQFRFELIAKFILVANVGWNLALGSGSVDPDPGIQNADP